MDRLHHSHDVLHRLSHRKKASPYANPLPIVPDRIDNAFQDSIIKATPALVPRTPQSTSSSSDSSTTSCASGDNSAACQKPESSSGTMTLPIVLGAVVPICVAFIILVFLHRRHVRKLRQEDMNDPHKSLDFGMDIGSQLPNSKRRKPVPEMVITDPEKSLRRNRQLSMDMGLGSPYLLPPELHNSRESFHSLSRSQRGDDDPYRHVSAYVGNDDNSVYSRRMGDGSSIRTGSSGGDRADRGDPMKQDLLRNAQRMSLSTPPPVSSSPLGAPEIKFPGSGEAMPRKPLPVAKGGSVGNLTAPNAPEELDAYMDRDLVSSTSLEVSQGPAELAAQPQQQPVMAQTENRKPPPPAIEITASRPTPTRLRSMSASIVIENAEDSPQHQSDDESDYGDALKVTPPSPTQGKPYAPSGPAIVEPAAAAEPHGGLEPEGLGYDIRRLSMGLRPLPPDDPTDDPEQRANRIRSFYKEYFDDSKPDPQNGIYETYEDDWLGDGAVYDPDTGGFIFAGAPPHAPFAQGGLPRRAMTPPPRAPPRFRGPPRNFSSLSGGGPMGPRGRPTQPKKRLPPPSPLQVLPTPHLLKEDSMSFLSPIDFAPPARYKDRAANRPDSPLGGSKPYSPGAPVHIPLASSFDDLTVMPSPHALRKSGTFTGLDFAPRHRFHDGDGGASDTGSIRSARSGISGAQMHAVRAGAYRVSRLPKDFVGTKQDLLSSLRPTWDVRDHTPTYPKMP